MELERLKVEARMPAEAWFAKARAEMVEHQLVARGIRDARVLVAMSNVRRHAFVGHEWAEFAYADRPLPTSAGQTISQPWIVARMLELAELRPEHRVLEIGTGSGYQTALLAELVAEVFSVESNAALATEARDRLRPHGQRSVHVRCADGTLGWQACGPYARVLAAAAAPRVPDAFFEQLVDGGLVVLPVGSRDLQRLEVWRRVGERRVREVHESCRFVPLIGQESWRSSTREDESS